MPCVASNIWMLLFCLNACNKQPILNDVHHSQTKQFAMSLMAKSNFSVFCVSCLPMKEILSATANNMLNLVLLLTVAGLRITISLWFIKKWFSGFSMGKLNCPCLLKTLTSSPSNTFGTDWSDDCEPGLIIPHQCWTLLTLLWLLCKSLQPGSKGWWKAWKQKSGCCYSSRLLLREQYVQQLHMGVMLGCPDTFLLCSVFYFFKIHYLRNEKRLFSVAFDCLFPSGRYMDETQPNV